MGGVRTGKSGIGWAYHPEDLNLPGLRMKEARALLRADELKTLDELSDDVTTCREAYEACQSRNVSGICGDELKEINRAADRAHLDLIKAQYRLQAFKMRAAKDTEES